MKEEKMTKFSNALLRGTIPIYGTVHGDGKDPLRTFEYLKAVKPRKSKLDEAFEKSERRLTTTSEI